MKVMEAVLQNVPKEDATTYEGLSRSEVIHGLERESGLTELLLRSAEGEPRAKHCSRLLLGRSV